jgi:phosphonate metabolism protein PhnN/1,5-bisphosphokinase (PRPP-forming)
MRRKLISPALNEPLTKGRLILVVGPSGAGKDTLIAAAKTALAADRRFCFPAREITRPGNTGGEAHIAVTADAFHSRDLAGAYALSWHAHDTWYGIPRIIDDYLATGGIVVVNVSRAVIDAARGRYPGTVIVHVTAPREMLVRRLEGRGRETDRRVAARLERGNWFAVAGPDVITVVNDGEPETAAISFIALLRRLNVAAAETA